MILCTRCDDLNPIDDYLDPHTGKQYKLCVRCRGDLQGANQQFAKKCGKCGKMTPEYKFHGFDGEDLGKCFLCRYSDVKLQKEPDDDRAEEYIELLENNLRNKREL